MPSPLRTPAFLGAILLLPVPVAGQQINERIAIAPDAAIRITSLAGTIRVTGWDRDSLVVTGTLPTATGRLYFGGAGSAAKLGVEPRDPSVPAEADLEVRVPRRARLWVKTDRAAVLVEGVTGSLDAYAVSGTIVVRAAPKQTYAESMDGSIEVEGEVTWLRLKSADGRIAFRGSAEDATASSVSGDVRLAGARFGRVRAETITGAVTFEGALDRGGNYLFETHGGDVELRFTSPVHAEVEATAIAGRITNLLTKDTARPGRGARGQELNLVAGQGGAQVVVRTFKGEIRLKP